LVGITAHYLIPGLGWPFAFLLGAIVSPPDAVAATSVIKGLGLSPRIVAILEGESLVNDASGLIAYKYALVAITAGNFVLWQAGLNFVFVATAGILIGLGIGYLILLVHKNWICDPIIEVTLTFLTPFAAYLIAEALHMSAFWQWFRQVCFYRSALMKPSVTKAASWPTIGMWKYPLHFKQFGFYFLSGCSSRSVKDGHHNIYSAYELIVYGLI
jgi:CPA1 family monovalent cation:H+ antiporter